MQVHRATLRDGTDVVVKVQHAQVGPLIKEDLLNTLRMVTMTAWMEPDYDLRPLIREYIKVGVGMEDTRP